MKKLLSIAVMCLCSLVLWAQKDVTTFLGIPVDGTKAEMIRKLKAKGFKYKTVGEHDFLNGEFNGIDVRVSVITNNNKVCRIMVVDRYPMLERDIKQRFNQLCRQFYDNKRYVCSSYLPDIIIPDKEDISYEMSVNEKRYKASFYQIPDSIIDSKRNNNDDEHRISLFLLSLNRPVWFLIAPNSSSDRYHIILYYDNEYNRANGEDL